MQAALERAIERMAFGPALDPNDATAAALFLRSCDVSDADVSAIIDAGFSRLLVYRILIRNGIRNHIGHRIPLTIERLGDAFEPYLDRFFDERGPRTHYLHDVTSELLDFCESLWMADLRMPPWTMALARYENAYHEIRMMAAPTKRARAEVVLDLPLQFTDAARLLRSQWAVHDFATNPAHGEPQARATSLIIYRNDAHDVRYLEVTSLAGAILERLMLGRRSVRDAIAQACADANVELREDVVLSIARLLSELADCGVLLGAFADDG